MKICKCGPHAATRRIVLTGGPGAGKTAVLELVRHAFCHHVRILEESAGIVFGGGFPREASLPGRRAAQRAIFHVQRELEALADESGASVVLCDRGTLDGLAYWPGPDDLCAQVGTTKERELARYDVVIHLQTPTQQNGYDRTNPLRVETAAEACAIDARIEEVWTAHPNRFVVPATADFLSKASAAIAILVREVPSCCSSGAAQPQPASAALTEATTPWK